MAKKTVAVLMQQARKYQEMARELERQQEVEIGELVKAYRKNDYQDFDVEKFRSEVERILEG